MAGRALAHPARPVKRFYKQATTGKDRRILLDGRPVKTPGRADLAPPSRALAEAIAAEWNAQGETIDPRAMPLTGLANAAIDRIAPDREAFARGLSVYGESDLTCYRAEGPPRLVERQAERWDPVLAWAAASLDEQWQAEQWGEDAEAAKALANRRADFAAGHRFLTLL